MPLHLQRNRIAALLVIVSFIILIPGLTFELITITATVKMMGMVQELFRETRSILQTVDNLYSTGNSFVASLILLFSVIIPFLKGILLLIVLGLKNAALRYKMYTFVRNVSKWSMADVFVVGVFVAFLSARANDLLDATLGSGFYYFAAYCIISLIALQLMAIDKPENHKKQPVLPKKDGGGI